MDHTETKKALKKLIRQNRLQAIKTRLQVIWYKSAWFTPWRIWKDAARYRKIRHLMGCNVEWTWERVEQLGGICAWDTYEGMDGMLDRTDVWMLYEHKFDWAWEGDLGRDRIIAEQLQR